MNDDIRNVLALSKIVAPALTEMTKACRKDVIEYDVPKGTSIGFGVFKSEECAIQRNFLSEGTEFPPHTHQTDIWEMLIVVRGRITCYIGEESGERLVGPLGPASHVVIERGVRHRVVAHEDTWVIGITIPADEGFPDDGQ